VGGRLFPAVVIVLVLLGALGWSAEHPVAAYSCGPNISFSRNQPGLRRMSGPLTAVLSRLPVRVRVAPMIGVPVGVYRTRRFALVLYGQRSLFGVFRLGIARTLIGQGRFERVAHQFVGSKFAGANEQSRREFAIGDFELGGFVGHRVQSTARFPCLSSRGWRSAPKDLTSHGRRCCPNDARNNL